jgi:hypothetical protein
MPFMESDRPYVGPLRPVVSIDIDGTIADYHKHFTNFAKQWLGYKSLLPDWDPELKGEFSEALGLEKHVYRQIKLAYRQGGMKRSIPPLGRPEDLFENLYDLQIQPWVCTTRPWERLDNIDPDTQEWLRRNGVKPYGMLYGEQKYRDLIEIVGKDRILAVIDDLPEQIETANSLGLKTILRTGQHNAWWREQHPEQHIANGLSQILGDVEAALIDWEKNK